MTKIDHTKNNVYTNEQKDQCLPVTVSANETITTAPISIAFAPTDFPWPLGAVLPTLVPPGSILALILVQGVAGHQGSKLATVDHVGLA